jgi:hypothetical protein
MNVPGLSDTDDSVLYEARRARDTLSTLSTVSKTGQRAPRRARRQVVWTMRVPRLGPTVAVMAIGVGVMGIAMVAKRRR